MGIERDTRGLRRIQEYFEGYNGIERDIRGLRGIQGD